MAVMDLVRALDEVLVTARNDLLSPEDGQLLLTEFPKAARLIHNFLEIKAPNESSKAKIVSGRIDLGGEDVVLDQQDIEQVLLLSSELNLDELHALELIERAYAMTGEVSAAGGAGQLFDERHAILQLLINAFKAQLSEGTNLPSYLESMIQTFTKDVMGRPEQGDTVVMQIIKQIGSSPLQARSGSRLDQVVTASHELADRNTLIHRERLLLCEALWYSCNMFRLATDELQAILDLLHSLMIKLTGSAHKETVMLQQLGLLLATAIQSILGTEDVSDEEISSLIRNQDIVRNIENDPQENAAAAALQLAWGTLLSLNGPPNLRARSWVCIDNALQRGALHCLRGLLSKGLIFEDPLSEDLLADLLNRLVLDFVDSDNYAQALEHLTARSYEVDDRDELLGLGSEIQLANILTPQRDGMHTMLLLFADVYGVHPQLWSLEGTRSETFSEFMSGTYNEGLLARSPSILVTYLGVLESLAGSEGGARAMFGQLQQDQAGPLSWHQALHAMLHYCKKYTDYQQEFGIEQQNRSGELVISLKDASAMRAYLQLLTKILNSASSSDFDSFVAALEQTVQVKPLWSLFLQLMCCPVPQILKAALDGVLASFVKDGESAEGMMTRLLASVVVQPNSIQTLTSGLSTADISFQLHEIQERAEDYRESIAFVHLLNTIYKTLGPQWPEQGRTYIQFTEFVRVELLGTIDQRTYKDNTQKWDLLSLSVSHMHTCLKNLDLEQGVDSLQGTPGASVLGDLWGGGSCWKACESLLMQGPHQIASNRAFEASGKAKESALLTILRFLEFALQIDTTALNLLKTSRRDVYLENLAASFRKKPRLVSNALGFVQYPYDQRVQAEAIKLAQHFTADIPDLVDLLQSANASGHAIPPVQIISGFASSLKDGIRSYSALKSDSSSSSDEDGGPNLVDLIIELLVHSLRQPAPSLGHLLLGFDCGNGVEGVSRTILQPLDPYSCTTILLDSLQNAPLQGKKSSLQVLVLEVFLELASSPITRISTLDLLRISAVIPTQIEQLRDYFGKLEGQPHLDSLKQAAYILDLSAIELYNTDAAIPAHQLSLRSLVQRLFGFGEEQQEVESEIPGALSLTLQSILSLQLNRPDLRIDSADIHQQALQKLAVGGLLKEASNEASISGKPVYDIAKLSKLLQTRLQKVGEEVQRFSLHEPLNELANACTSVLQFAQKWNAFVEAEDVREAAILSWQSCVEVVLSRRYELLETWPLREAPPPSPHQILESLLNVTLDAIQIGNSQTGHLLPILLQVVRLILVRLQPSTEQQDYGIPAPTLQRLLHLLANLPADQSLPELRVPLYGSLIATLSFARPSSRGLEATNPGGDRTQTLISEAVGRGQILGLLVTDAAGLSSQTVAKILALTCLSKLTLSSPQILEHLLHAGFPQQLLQEMLSLTDKAFLKVSGISRPAQDAIPVITAQAQLLLCILQAGTSGPLESAKLHISSLPILPGLTQCKVLDLQPEDYGPNDQPESLRGSLDKIVPILLKLAAILSYKGSASRQLIENASVFAEAHRKSFLRILKEAGDRSNRFWPPSNSGLEQATLVLQVLSRLATLNANLGQASGEYQAAALTMLQGLPRHYDVGTPQFPTQNSLLTHVQKVVEMKSALLTYLRELIVNENQALQLPLAPSGSGSQNHVSLVAVVALLDQALDELIEANTKQPLALEGPSSQANLNNDLEGAVVEWTGKSKETLPAPTSISPNKKVLLLLAILENALAIILFCVSASRSKPNVHKEMDHLKQALRPCLNAISHSVKSQPKHSSLAIDNLVQRIKDALADTIL